jgi:hypothetical protein
VPVAPVLGAALWPPRVSPAGLSIEAGTTAADVDIAAMKATIRIIDRDIALPFF